MGFSCNFSLKPINGYPPVASNMASEIPHLVRCLFYRTLELCGWVGTSPDHKSSHWQKDELETPEAFVTESSWPWGSSLRRMNFSLGDHFWLNPLALTQNPETKLRESLREHLQDAPLESKGRFIPVVRAFALPSSKMVLQQLHVFGCRTSGSRESFGQRV